MEEPLIPMLEDEEPVYPDHKSKILRISCKNVTESSK